MTGARSRPNRVAVIATHPIQYQVPLWRALSARDDLEIMVFYAADFSATSHLDPGFGRPISWDVPLLDGYRYWVAKGGAFTGAIRFNPAEWMEALEAFDPDCALITAYWPSFWAKIIALLSVLRVPMLLRAETTDSAVDRRGITRAAREGYLRVVYASIARFLAIGKNSREHYLEHAVMETRIGFAPYCVDTDFFEQQIQRWAPRRGQTRRDLGFGEEDVVFMFSGKLIDKKNPLIIADALRHLASDILSRVGLVCAGEGVLRKDMEARCRDVLGSRAIFVGFCTQTEVTQFLACSDCLILPSASGETWGLVVNEALQCGVPAIVSDKVGCAPDLVIEGKTGLSFPSNDAVALSAAMARVAGWPQEKRGSIAAECRGVVAEYSSARAVAGIADGIRRICEDEMP